MSRICLISLTLILLTACHEGTPDPDPEPEEFNFSSGCLNDNNAFDITGTWQLAQQAVSSGGPIPSWTVVTDGFIISLDSAGRFSSGQFTECQAGSYIRTDSTLVKYYDCEERSGPLTETLCLSDTTMFWASNYCLEGCLYQFVRLY